MQMKNETVVIEEEFVLEIEELERQDQPVDWFCACSTTCTCTSTTCAAWDFDDQAAAPAAPTAEPIQ